MKRTIIGFALLISATLADMGIIISASLLADGLTDLRLPSGRLWTAITENRLILPFLLAKILFVLAIIVLAREYFSKAIKQL